MCRTGAPIGAITNLESWIVLERAGDAIEVSFVDGTVKGRSNALNILLSMSLKAIAIPKA